MPKSLTPSGWLMRMTLCVWLLITIMTLCIFVGTQKISIENAITGWGSEPGQNTDYDILVRVRIPRVILAALIGAALAASGVALQAILRNPLAEPYILGISSGAGLGVLVAAISGVTWQLWGGSPLAGLAFLFAIGTVWLVWFIGRLAGGFKMTSLLLAGVVVNAFFSAVIMLLTTLIDSRQLRSIVFWLMGNITEKDLPVLRQSAIFIGIGILGLCIISHKLNILTFGREESQSLGVNYRAVTFAAFIFASFITAVAVSLSGLVGFVGLVIPHSVRLVFGPDHRQLIPASALIGAGFVVICDTIARVIIAPAQLPVGVITAIIGGPVFLLLLAGYSRKTGAL